MIKRIIVLVTMKLRELHLSIRVIQLRWDWQAHQGSVHGGWWRLGTPLSIRVMLGSDNNTTISLVATKTWFTKEVVAAIAPHMKS